MPIGDTFEVNTALCALEIIDISYRSFFVSSGSKAWDKLGEFGRKGEIGRCFGIDAWKEIHKFGDEGGFVAVVEVNAPDTVAGGFFTEIVLLGERFFVEVHKRSPYVEIRFNLVV